MSEGMHEWLYSNTMRITFIKNILVIVLKQGYSLLEERKYWRFTCILYYSLISRTGTLLLCAYLIVFNVPLGFPSHTAIILEA